MKRREAFRRAWDEILRLTWAFIFVSGWIEFSKNPSWLSFAAAFVGTLMVIVLIFLVWGLRIDDTS